jgi:Winged helix-turn helix
MRIAIQQEISRSEESRYDHRLHGLLLVCNGQSCVQVADLFGEDRRTIQRWVTRFEALGLEGLREGERPGRPQRAYFRASWTLISGHRGQRFQVIVDGRFTTIVDDFDGPDFRAVHDQRCGWR